MSKKKTLGERIAEELAIFVIGFIGISFFMILMSLSKGEGGTALALICIDAIIIFFMLHGRDENHTQKRPQSKNFKNESSLKWKKCKKCRHKLNIVAKKCPYCGFTFKN